eukprot:scaffold36826_cov57-Cyclotella_meneghiniana.AAC.1
MLGGSGGSCVGGTAMVGVGGARRWSRGASAVGGAVGGTTQKWRLAAVFIENREWHEFSFFCCKSPPLEFVAEKGARSLARLAPTNRITCRSPRDPGSREQLVIGL